MGILADRFPRSRTGTGGFWITDGGKAMINAIEGKFLNAKRQRCIKHKMDNVLGYVPTEQQNRIYRELRAIFYQDNLQKAQQTAAAVFTQV